MSTLIGKFPPRWIKGLFIGLLVVNIGLFVKVYFQPDGLEHLYFFDVGQGDASLIKTANNHYILIDGGPNNSVITALDRVIPMWHRQLDLVILTHPHADHITGLLSVFDRYQVKEFWHTGTPYDSETYRTLLAKANDKQIPTRLANLGDEYTIDQTTLRVIFPLAENPSAADPNATSIVGVLEYKNFDVLFTGDANTVNEAAYLPQVPDVDVIKIPHHGSHNSSSPALVNQAKPESGVIMVGAKNSFGHPHPDTLERYQVAGTKVYRTDQNGTVEIVTDGNRYQLHSS